MMYGRGKSSPVIVARKPANKAQPDSVTAAESVERRAGAEGNANQQSTRRTPCRVSVSQALDSIRQAAMLDCQYPRWEPYAGKLQVCGGREATRVRRDMDAVRRLGGRVGSAYLSNTGRRVADV